ncbi:Dehydrodolichyl diphosphate synthase 2 [Abeliophyllum distichum]|uniref:Alkyl transferase n=1 Tax=Abeliophyllum distichum TaxID=126358 RepID=A0ABD1NYF0_9LAMI
MAANRILGPPLATWTFPDTWKTMWFVQPRRRNYEQSWKKLENPPSNSKNPSLRLSTQYAVLMEMRSLQLQLSLTPSLFKPKLLSHLPYPILRLRSPPVASLPRNAISISQSQQTGVVQNGALEEEYSVSLPEGLLRELMPTHVAVIMDGNRRVLTVFAFSSNNWFRPKVETDFLMGLFERGLRDELENFTKAGIRISVIGDSAKLPKPLQVLITDALEVTKNNSRLHLIMAVNYSGQKDIVQACQSISLKVKDGVVKPEDINEFLIEDELETNCTDFPCPDLLIRTSGELRISNFLLWQLAYTELYFAHTHWPDFGEDEFLEALSSFQQRQRRYGGQNS